MQDGKTTFFRFAAGRLVNLVSVDARFRCRRNLRVLTFIVFLAALASLVGCTSNGGDAIESEEATEQGSASEETESSTEGTTQDETDDVEFGLPGRVDSSNCIQPTPAPTKCEWLTSTTDIIRAEVTDSRFVYEPVYFGANIPADDCVGYVSPAFELDVDVLGSVHGRAPSELTLRFGVPQWADSWTVGPYPDANGDVRWLDDPRALTVGKRFGVAVHEHDGWWSPLGEHFFELGSTGRAKFESVDLDCAEPPPLDVNGFTIPQMAAEVANCDPDAGDARRARMNGLWTGRQTYAYAATCTQREPDPEGCVSNSQCLHGELCVDGDCKTP